MTSILRIFPSKVMEIITAIMIFGSLLLIFYMGFIASKIHTMNKFRNIVMRRTKDILSNEDIDDRQIDIVQGRLEVQMETVKEVF